MSVNILLTTNMHKKYSKIMIELEHAAINMDNLSVNVSGRWAD